MAKGKGKRTKASSVRRSRQRSRVRMSKVTTPVSRLSVPKQSSWVEMLDHVKVLYLVHSPRHFFESVRKEESMWPSWFLYVIVAIVVTVVQSVVNALMQSAAGADTVLAVAGLFGGLVGGVAAATIMPFIAAGLTHLGVLLVKGSQGFPKTFKASTYPQVVGELYLLITWVMYAIGVLLYGPDASAFPFWVLVLIVPIVMVMVVHVMYLQVIGISILQKVTMGRALIAVIVPTLALIAAMILVVMAILLGVVLITL